MTQRLSPELKLSTSTTDPSIPFQTLDRPKIESLESLNTSQQYSSPIVFKNKISSHLSPNIVKTQEQLYYDDEEPIVIENGRTEELQMIWKNHAKCDFPSSDEPSRGDDAQNHNLESVSLERENENHPNYNASLSSLKIFGSRLQASAVLVTGILDSNECSESSSQNETSSMKLDESGDGDDDDDDDDNIDSHQQGNGSRAHDRNPMSLSKTLEKMEKKSKEDSPFKVESSLSNLKERPFTKDSVKANSFQKTLADSTLTLPSILFPKRKINANEIHSISELLDSTPIIQSDDLCKSELWIRFATYGYLYFPNFFESSLIAEAREKTLAVGSELYPSNSKGFILNLDPPTSGIILGQNRFETSITNKVASKSSTYSDQVIKPIFSDQNFSQLLLFLAIGRSIVESDDCDLESPREKEKMTMEQKECISGEKRRRLEGEDGNTARLFYGAHSFFPHHSRVRSRRPEEFTAEHAIIHFLRNQTGMFSSPPNGSSSSSTSSSSGSTSSSSSSSSSKSRQSSKKVICGDCGSPAPSSASPASLPLQDGWKWYCARCLPRPTIGQAMVFADAVEGPQGFFCFPASKSDPRFLRTSPSDSRLPINYYKLLKDPQPVPHPSHSSFSSSSSSFSTPPIPPVGWQTASFQPGDLLLIDSSLIHCSAPIKSDSKTSRKTKSKNSKSDDFERRMVSFETTFCLNPHRVRPSSSSSFSDDDLMSRIETSSTPFNQYLMSHSNIIRLK